MLLHEPTTHAGGKMAVTAHVVPNSALRVADIPDGPSTFNTVAGTPIKVEKRWVHRDAGSRLDT